MNLPVLRPRTYISPSAFLTWRRCQAKLYHESLSGRKFVDRESSFAAGLGTIVDYWIKKEICRVRNIDIPLDHLLEIKWENKNDADRALKLGKEIADRYLRNKFHQFMLDADEILIDRRIYSTINGVPILGIPDFIVDRVPDDIKTRGFTQATASPSKGYIERFDHYGMAKGAHKQYCSLDQSKPDWAIQVLFYNWLVKSGHRKYIIHEIVNTTHGWDLAIHKGEISENFEVQILQELQSMWTTINVLDIDILEPDPTKWRCEMYGQLCDVAIHCAPYMATMTGEAREGCA